MLDDLKKSISSTLYERTTSPFYGTLIISWAIWNWKIIYLTIFISEDVIQVNKINYILTNFTNTNHLITYPLISAIIFLTIMPFVSNGAYWLSLKFNKWKKDQKNQIEKQQLLTLEQSIELREQIFEQENRFEKLLENKNIEIQQLKAIIESNKNSPEKSETKSLNNLTDDVDIKELEDLAERIITNEAEKKQYERIMLYAQNGYQMSGESAPNPKFVTLFESYNIIRNKGNAVYELTETGKRFHRVLQLNERRLGKS